MVETLKLIVVLGVLAAGVAIGLAYVVAAFTGGRVTGDEIERHVLISFVIVTATILVLRRRNPR